jgi:hypothetical protein
MSLLSYVVRIYVDIIHKHRIVLNVMLFRRYQGDGIRLNEDERRDEQERSRNKREICIFEESNLL